MTCQINGDSCGSTPILAVEKVENGWAVTTFHGPTVEPEEEPNPLEIGDPNAAMLRFAKEQMRRQQSASPRIKHHVFISLANLTKFIGETIAKQ